MPENQSYTTPRDTIVVPTDAIGPKMHSPILVPLRRTFGIAPTIRPTIEGN